MAHIHLLDESIAQKIAAGEVVERPTSVVKELVENSIDAGSTFVTVEIKEGGIEYLRVTDNGIGIAADEVELAFLRHATSKIQQIDDLYNIRQLGFRGEALYSISAVSRLELTSKPVNQPTGVRMVIHGGQRQSLGEYGCPDGTTMLVRDLFYNTPARLKFLSKPATEAGYVSSVIMKLILANPAISIKFINNDKVVYHSTGDGNLVNAIYSIFGKDITDGLISVDQNTVTRTLQGVLFAPAHARGNRANQILMVNGRNVTHFAVSTIIERLYAGMVENRRYPGFVLNLTLPSHEVDVNVHPNKLQVRFLDEHAIRRLVESAVSQALQSLRTQMIPWNPPQADGHADETPTIESYIRPASRMDAMPDTSRLGVNVGRSTIPERMDQTVSRYTESVQATTQGSLGWRATPINEHTLMQRPSIINTATHRDEAAEQERFIPQEDEPKLLGQAFGLYALVQAGEKLLVIDQHAAHERLWYDRYADMLERAETFSQRLLVPQTISVSFEAKITIDENLDLLHSLGFELEDYGRLTYRIRSVPVILGQPQVQSLLMDIVDMLQEDRSVRTLELKREKIMSMACKKAVKAGDRLSNSELNALVKLFQKEGMPLTCPHGRPFVMAMDKSILDRHFKRT